MKISQKGLNLIKEFEGLRLKAYKALPSEKYYTIGYGHYAASIKKDDVITEEEAEHLLIQDLSRAEKSVNSYDKCYNFNQNQYDALVSFTFNCGDYNLNTLLQFGMRPISEVRKAITKYVHDSNKNVIPGLVRRRAAELALFDSEVDMKKDDDTINRFKEYTFNLIITSDKIMYQINDVLADEVISGKWGIGNDRKKELERYGFDYNQVQKLVNEKMKRR